VFPWIRTRDGEDLTVLGVTAESVYPRQSLAPQFNRDSMSLVPDELSMSNPSKALHGSTCAGYESPASAIDTAINRAAYSHWTYTHIYWPMIDKSSHEYGTEDEKTCQLVSELDAEMQRLRSGLPEDSRLVVIADHGHLNIREDQKFLIAPDDPLTKLLTSDVSGDTKTAIFHVKEGAKEAFAQQFREKFGDHFFLFSAQEVAELELFGPDGITDFTAGRLGDFIAVAKGQEAIKFQTPENTREISQFSEHGGLTPDEMLVPIVIA
jgi:predicted AlkP superfamily pyrophosphatase or phosphodiesterase